MSGVSLADPQVNPNQEIKNFHQTAVFVFVAECQDLSYFWSVRASEFYRGRRSVTRSGKKCSNWSTVGGLQHVGDHNHCRNPNSQWEGVGCYTDDGGNEPCEVPTCTNF